MRARLVTYGLLALLAWAAWQRVEWWPVTSFRLFSQPRTGIATGWEVDLVDGTGSERAVPFGRLPRSYHGARSVASTLAREPAPRRDAVCRAWATAGGRVLGVTPVAVRVYHVTGQVRRRPADRVPPPDRTLVVECPA